MFINDLSDSLEILFIYFVMTPPFGITIPHPSDGQAAASSFSEDLERITTWSNTRNMSFNHDKYHTLTMSLRKDRIANPPIYLLNKPLEKFSNSNFWASNSTMIFIGKNYTSKLSSKVSSRLDNGHLPSCNILPWHIWALIHLQGLHPQVDGVLLSPLGWLHCCFTHCLTWCRGNQGLQDHGNLPWWNWVDGPITFTSQTGRCYLCILPYALWFCTLCPFCAMHPPPGFCRTWSASNTLLVKLQKPRLTAHLHSFVPLFPTCGTNFLSLFNLNAPSRASKQLFTPIHNHDLIYLD